MIRQAFIIIFVSIVCAFSVNAQTSFSRQLVEKAQKGDVQAQIDLGDCYLFGRGIDKNYDKAIEWYRKASDQNNALGLKCKGTLYLFGIGVEKDLFAAFKLFEQAYAKGDRVSRTYLDDSNFFEPNFEYQLITSAESGNPEAQYYLAKSFGNHAEAVYKLTDSKKCFHWMKTSADNGNADAIFTVAGFYYNGFGTPVNKQEAIAYYKRGAEKNQAMAQFVYGKILASGEGTSKNEEEALYWIRKSAENGNGEAMNEIGNCYYDGLLGLSKNLQNAFSWYKKGAEGGAASALTNLGRCYYLGYGTSKDFWKAVTCWNKAARIGNKEARGFLASNAIQIGTKFPGHFKKMKEAAEKGAADAQAFVAGAYLGDLPRIYRFDNSDPHEEAAKWLIKAAENGHQDSFYEVGELYETGTIALASNIKDNYTIDTEIEYNNVKKVRDVSLFKAADYYNRSINSNDHNRVFSMLRMAKAYYNQDDELADLNYEKCAQLLKSAIEELERMAPSAQLAECYNMLSKCYRLGRGVTADEKKADLFTSKSIRLGNANALNVKKALTF